MKNPVHVYSPASVLEAGRLVEILEQAGIEAHVLDDRALAEMGTLSGWMLGFSPKVMVDASAVETVVPILREYHRSRAIAARADLIAWETGYSVPARCEDCGKTALYTPADRGTVQKCPFCTAHVDVGDSEDGDWGEPEE